MRFAAGETARRLLWGAASAVFLLLISSLLRVPGVPAPLVVSLFTFAAVAAWRPGPGLLLLAATLPVATWTGRQWNGDVAWTEAVAVAYLAGYGARRALDPRRGPAEPLVHAIHGMIAVVAASLAVQLLFLRGTVGGLALGVRLWTAVTSDYFVSPAGFESVDAAMRLIEGLLILHASLTMAGSSQVAGLRLTRAVVAGAVAASALNLWRLWLGAVRIDEPVVGFLRYLATMRFNTHYADINAAGSYYVMALGPALGFARVSAPWMAAAVIIGLSLILTGSRTAMIAAVAAFAIVWIASRKNAAGDPAQARSRRRLVIASLLIVTCAAALYLGVARNLTPATGALWIRGEFALTGLRMLASRPFFGVGIGQYHSRSAEFSSPELRAIYLNENAHNNFLQILAELGVVGLVVFVSVLWLTAGRVIQLLAGRTWTAPQSVAAGLLAFVLTWLAGHPLLIDAPALSFWLLLGAAAGWRSVIPTAEAAAPTSRPALTGDGSPTSRSRALIVALVIVLTASIPFRARQALAAADLEHMGIGLSGWQTGPDGVEYRLAGVTSTIFVPAAAGAIAVPIRSSEDADVEVELRLDARHADRVRVPSDAWRTVTIQVPQHRDGRRFRPLELRVRNGSGPGAPVLMVGKVQRR